MRLRNNNSEMVPAKLGNQEKVSKFVMGREVGQRKMRPQVFLLKLNRLHFLFIGFPTQEGTRSSHLTSIPAHGYLLFCWRFIAIASI